MPEVIVNKIVRVSGEDRLTSVIARTNQAMENLQQHMEALGMKFSSSATSTTGFKTSLNEVKANAGETNESLNKLNNTINKLKGDHKVNVEANTGEAVSKTTRLQNTIDRLSREKPTISPKANTGEAEENLHRLQRTSESVGSSFTRLRTIIAGTAVGGMISNGFVAAFGSIKAGIVGAMNAGIQFDMNMQKMNATWTTLTGSAGKAKTMTNSIVELSNSLGQSVEVTDELSQQFYHVLDNQPATEKLTKSFLTMGDAIGLSGDRLTQVGMDFTHMLSSSKMQLGDLNQITDAFPMFGNALLQYERKVQHSSHLTMSELRKDISAGKIDAKDAEVVMNNLGDKYKEASDNLMGTLPGMFRQISAKWKQLMGDAMAPSTDAANPIVKQVSEWIGDKQTTTEFETLGKAVNNGVGAVMKALADSFGNGSVSEVLDNMVNSLTRMVQAVSKWTAGNASSIVTTIKALGNIAGSFGKGAFDAVSDMLKALTGASGTGLKGIANSLNEISKHKTAIELIGRAFAIYFVYSKFSKAANGLLQIGNALGIIGKHKLSGNIFSDFAKGIERLKNTKVSINPANWFKGGSSWAKNLFKPMPQEALKSGDEAGGNFVTRFAAKTNSSRFAQVGRSLGGRIISGVGLAIEAYDLVKDITGAFTTHNGTTRSRDVGKAAGAGIGAGIGAFFGGPAGAALGGLIGRAIGGKIGPSVGRFGNSIGKVLNDIFVKHDWNGVWSTIGKGWQSFWKGMGDWWDKTIGKKGSNSSSKQPSEHEIKSLGGNHYSKADIANIKEMNRAVESYTSTLKKLKQVIKQNDPTKELNSMNKSLKASAKYWLAVTKPLNNAAKSFKTMRSPIKSIADEMKNLTGKKSGLGTFDKDLTKLQHDLKSSKLGDEFKKLSDQIKKSNLVKSLKQLTDEVRDSVKYWKQLAKPLEQSDEALKGFSKSLKPFNSKSNPLDRLNSSVEKLTKTLKHDRFGNELAQQMNAANKSMSGRDSVESKFSSMTRTIERDLSKFRSTFNHDWRNTWSRINQEPSRALSQVVSTATNRFDSIRGRERSFISAFNSAWRSWTSGVVSTMRSEFSKLPGIAQKAMSEIVSRLNRGISGVNSVIDQFGGDKKLSMIHYAQGTLVHPGGKAILNDGPTAQKQEIVWEPSKGFSLPQGQYQVRDLERGAMVIDAPHSAPVLASAGIIPHYAAGTLSDEEQEKMAEAFENNPVQASRNLILKLTNWNGAAIFGSLGKAMAIGFSRGIANVLKDLLGEVKEPVNGDWTPVIKSAAAHMHVTLSAGQIAKLLRQIQTESGGNEKITQQISDVNSAAGHPAQGLLQFIPSTFNTWALPGHHNILSGFDQIMAAINALNHGGEGGWGNIGNGHGWASGVHMTHHDYALIGDNAEQDEYVINPYNANALPLMQDAYQTMSNNHPEWRQPVSSAFNSEVIGLIRTAIDKLDNIDIRPYTTVEEIARPVNKYNAKAYMLRR